MDIERAVEEATRAITADYEKDVDDVADEMVRRVEDGEIEDRDQFQESLDEYIDGHQRVIYTWQARLGLLATSNGDAYEDDFGEAPDTPEKAMYAAMQRDVWEQLDRMGFDPDDDDVYGEEDDDEDDE